MVTGDCRESRLFYLCGCNSVVGCLRLQGAVGNRRSWSAFINHDRDCEAVCVGSHHYGSRQVAPPVPSGTPPKPSQRSSLRRSRTCFEAFRPTMRAGHDPAVSYSTFVLGSGEICNLINSPSEPFPRNIQSIRLKHGTFWRKVVRTGTGCSGAEQALPADNEKLFLLCDSDFAVQQR